MTWNRFLALAGLAALGGAVGLAGGARAAEPQPFKLGNITGTAPADWASQPVTMQFREAQFALPKAAGDPAAPQLIVFYFGEGGAGSVEENLKRWRGMVRLPEGADPEKSAKQETRERNGLKITTVDVAGTYLDRPFPMAREATPRANYRLLAAVVEATGEGGGGPYYLRLVGPAKSVAAAKPGWEALLASLKAP